MAVQMLLGLENGVRRVMPMVDTSSGTQDAQSVVLLDSTGKLNVTLLPPGSGGSATLTLDREFFEITAQDLTNGYITLTYEIYGEVDATEVQIRNGLCMFYEDDFVVAADGEGKMNRITWTDRGMADTLVVGDKICVKYMRSA